MPAQYHLDFNVKGSGFKVNEVAGETLGNHKLVYRGADSLWYLADASVIGTMPVLGITMGAITITRKGEILRLGYIGDDSWTWTPGGEIYASDTAGELSQVAGTVSQIMGMAVTATMIWFNSDLGNGGGGAVGAHVLATTGPHTSTLPLTDLAVGTQGEIIHRGAVDWEVLAVGNATDVLTSGGAGADVSWVAAGAPAGHHATHEDGGGDEVEIDDLPGANGAAGEIVESDGAAMSFVEPDGRYAPAAHVLATTGPHSAPLPLIDLEVGVQGEVIHRGAADWEALGVGNANDVLTSGGAGVDVSWVAPGSAADTRGSTIIVAASDSLDPTLADAAYRCSGANDDVEIQAAIDAVAAGVGGRVMFLEGNYSIDAKLEITTDNIMLQGQGAGTIITASANGVNGIDILGLVGTYIENITIRDIQLIGFGRTGVGNSIGIDVRYTNYVNIANCFIHDWDEDGVQIRDSNIGTVTNCEVTVCGGIGIKGASNMEFYKLTNNDVFDVTGNGIQASGMVNVVANNNIEEVGGYGILTLQHCTIVGNHLDETDGIWTQAYTTVVGNDIKHSYDNSINATQWSISVVGNHIHHTNTSNDIGIRLGGNDNTCIGNTIWEIGKGFTGCIAIEVLGDNCIVSGNSMRDSDESRGIVLTGATNCVISNNTVKEAEDYGIFIRSVSTGNYFEGNLITDSTTAAVRIDDAASINNDFSGGNSFQGLFVDNGVGTIYPVKQFRFTEPVSGAVTVVTSPTGIDVDAATEAALSWGQLPANLQQVMRLKIWGVATGGPIGAGGQMHLEVVFNAGAGNAAYNTAAKSWVLTNHDSEEADYVADDVVHWEIIDSDVGTELLNLAAGDSFEVFALHEAGADPDGATECLFRVVEVEYV